MFSLAGLSSAADVSVRPAVPGDEQAITAVQLLAWRYAAVLDEAVLDLLDAPAMTASWQSAIESPPTPQHRVLVACDGPRLVGFIAVMPDAANTQTATGTIVSLEVAPVDQRSGHGSRLLAAAVDMLRGDNAQEISVWILPSDDARVRFFSQAGFGPDGATRQLTGRPGPQDGRSWSESHWSATI